MLLANIITLALLAGAYIYLKSDHGQMLLYELGLQSAFFSLTSSQAIVEVESSDSFDQPRISDMKPMRVDPSQNRHSQATSSPPEGTTASSSPKRNQSAIDSSLKMCRFWNTRFKEDGSSQSKAYRTNACNRYERLSGRDINNVMALASSQRSPSYQEQRDRQEKARQAKLQAEEQQELERYCERVRQRIDHYDALLRAGGSAHYVNRVRAERKEISLKYSRKCLLGQ